MQEQFENALKEQLNIAFPAEPVPQALQRKLLLREAAVVTGRRAESILKRGDSPERADELLSQAMVGRVARITEFPGDATPEALARSIRESEGFRMYRRQSMEQQLHGLNGSFLKEIAPKQQSATQVSDVKANAKTSDTKSNSKTPETRPHEKGKTL